MSAVPGAQRHQTPDNEVAQNTKPNNEHNHDRKGFERRLVEWSNAYNTHVSAGPRLSPRKTRRARHPDSGPRRIPPHNNSCRIWHRRTARAALNEVNDVTRLTLRKVVSCTKRPGPGKNSAMLGISSWPYLSSSLLVSPISTGELALPAKACDPSSMICSRRRAIPLCLLLFHPHRRRLRATNRQGGSNILTVAYVHATAGSDSWCYAALGPCKNLAILIVEFAHADAGRWTQRHFFYRETAKRRRMTKDGPARDWDCGLHGRS